MAHRGDVTKRLLVGTMVALALFTSGCGLIIGDWAKDGQVIDTETMTPIAGALVIAEWTADIGGPAQSSQVCFHLEVVTTDATGHYHIPAWHRRPVADWEGGIAGLNNVESWRRTYKEGYVHLHDDPRIRSTTLMEPFRGTPEERIELLAREGTVGCGKHDGSRVHELTLWKAICDEARKIPLARQPQVKFHNESFLQLIARHQLLIIEDLRRTGSPDASAPLDRCDEL